jgi:hypothetical protein
MIPSNTICQGSNPCTDAKQKRTIEKQKVKVSPDKNRDWHNTAMLPKEQMLVTKSKTRNNGTATTMEKTKRRNNQQAD